MASRRMPWPLMECRCSGVTVFGVSLICPAPARTLTVPAAFKARLVTSNTRESCFCYLKSSHTSVTAFERGDYRTRETCRECAVV